MKLSRERNKIRDRCHQRYRRTRTEGAGSPGCGSRTQLIEPPTSPCPGHHHYEGDDGGLDGGETEPMTAFLEGNASTKKLFNPRRDQDHCIVSAAMYAIHYCSSLAICLALNHYTMKQAEQVFMFRVI